MDLLDSENENEAELIRLNPIMISIGTSCGTNADSSLVILYQV
jgi:hypothetical protein